jgi:hypothetical protein
VDIPDPSLRGMVSERTGSGWVAVIEEVTEPVRPSSGCETGGGDGSELEDDSFSATLVFRFRGGSFFP